MSYYCHVGNQLGQAVLFAFLLLGILGGAVGAAVVLVHDGSLLLALLCYSLAGSLTVLIAAIIYVIVTNGRQRRDSNIAVGRKYRFE